MENIEVGRILNAYADLLDIEGENPFRVRSYRHAAQTVEGLSVPIAQLIEQGEDITKLPGIGTSMAEHIQEILQTGTLSALEQLHREFPSTMTDLMRLEHLGPKRAKQLYDALGVASVGQLTEALDAGSVEKLSGFGKKTAANLRPDEVLEGFDIVLISVHSGLNMTKAQMTKRICKALAHPGVDILAHPTCRQINTREPIEVDLDEVFHVAKEHDVAVELDDQPQRLDLNDVHLHRACELGLKVVIDTDAHSVDQLRFMRYGSTRHGGAG